MRRSRAAAAASLAAAAALLGAACSDIVTGETMDAVGRLCSQLQSCYDDAKLECGRMERTLESADAATRAEFLDRFDPAACLGTCPGSLACLDVAPYCGGEACATELDCCGWSLGTAACAEIDGATRCCRPDGVACAADDDCCERDCERGYCGGFACTVVGQPCSRGVDCCSRRCDAGTCAAKTCSDLGEPCVDDGDCCEDPTAPESAAVAVSAVCRDSVCQPAEGCVPTGSICEAGVTCCGEGEACVVGAPDLPGICAQPGCFGPGIDCAYDVQCCAGTYCDYTFPQPVCVHALAACSASGAPCGDGVDAPPCCSNNCVDGSCSQFPPPDCQARGTCHSPCAEGAALDATVCEGSGFEACIATIVESDAFCSCTAWDSLCVQSALALCSC